MRSSAASIPTAISSTATGSIARAGGITPARSISTATWLTEAARLDDVLKPAGETPLWFGEVDKENTTIWAQFPGVNPERATGRDQRPPDGVLSRQAGQQLHHRARLHHAPRGHALGAAHGRAGRPDRHPLEQGLDHREQRDQPLDLLGHRAREVRRPVGQHVGRHRRGLRQDHRARPRRTAGTRRTIGHHVVRNNTISHCEQAGIVGSLGAAFSAVTGNTIHDIHVRRLFSGPRWRASSSTAPSTSRSAAITSTGPAAGLWLDWMAQGTRVSGNLFHDNDEAEDLFVEVDHGPFLVDNNIFLSPNSLSSRVAGRRLCPQPVRRCHEHQSLRRPQDPFPQGPLHRRWPGCTTTPAATTVSTTTCSSGAATWAHTTRRACPCWMDGNVFLGHARPSRHETNPLQEPGLDPAPRLIQTADGLGLELKLEPTSWSGKTRARW